MVLIYENPHHLLTLLRQADLGQRFAAKVRHLTQGVPLGAFGHASAAESEDDVV
jgi:hypothetical protein